MPDSSNLLPKSGDGQPLTPAFPEVPADRIEPEFDEAAYLRTYPDVAAAVERGDLQSGYDHYLLAGKAERRLEQQQYRHTMGLPPKVMAEAPTRAVRGHGPGAGVDTVMVSESGAIFISGWTDDRQNRLVAINLRVGQAARHSWTKFPRLRRRDVEESLYFTGSYQHGFWVFAGSDDRPGPRPAPREATFSLELCYANGTAVELNRVPVLVPDADLRDTVMRYFAACEYLGNSAIEACISLDGGAGDALTGFNRAISRGFASQALVEHFGPTQHKPKVSIIVPLYGIGDYFFLQSSAYAEGRGMSAYEFIYAVNSPELMERLCHEARIAQMIYGLPQTLVTLPGNAGRSAATNAAAQFARSDRLLCINPDVFPRDPDWARRHLDVLANLPEEQTRLFGSSLYYDDGSLMHGGIYFEIDPGFHNNVDGVTRRNMIRMEHYGKGAPHWANQYVASRPVPAVTGAFLSIDRAWFEKLGGFTENYVFGHYEDADLCLKSLRRGVPAWLHDIRMLHLEGNGSRRSTELEGGSLVNRWHFARTWMTAIVPDLIGRTPQLRMLRPDDDAAAGQACDVKPNGAAPTAQAKLRDAKPNDGASMVRATRGNGAAPAGRVKSPAIRPNGATLVGRPKLRGVRSNGGASTDPATLRSAKPNSATPTGKSRLRGTKPNHAAPTRQSKPGAPKPAVTSPRVRPSSHRPR
jgi:GT2 family glycosyltransferase